MSTLKKLYYDACSLLLTRLFRSGGPSRLLLPYHHTVSNHLLPHLAHLYSYKNEHQFEADLDYLLKNFKVVSPDVIASAVSNREPLPKGSFLLTFDDGFREVNDIIAPLLQKKGVPAIFFINPDFIDNKQLFYRCKISILIGELKKNSGYAKVYAAILQAPHMVVEQLIESLKKITQLNAHILDRIAEEIGYSFQNFLEQQQPFLTRGQLTSLDKSGFTIGAHSMNHPYYNLLPQNEQVRQTLDSCNYVKELLNSKICHFSFPHSDAPVLQSTIDLINEQNEGLLFGIQNQKQETANRVLHRFNAERPEINIDVLVKGQILMNSLQKASGSFRIIRKK